MLSNDTEEFPFGSTPFNKNFTIGSPDQKQSTSGSTTCNKRKSQDFNVEEVASKILKLDEPIESFSDEKFVDADLEFLKYIDTTFKKSIKSHFENFISKLRSIKDT